MVAVRKRIATGTAAVAAAGLLATALPGCSLTGSGVEGDTSNCEYQAQP